MATAPTPGGPGTVAAQERQESASQTIRLILWPKLPEPEERTRLLNPQAIPFKERLVCRKATGMAFESFMVDQEAGLSSVGMDTVMVWWWMAGRKDNPLLTLNQSLDDWPDEITEDTIEVELIEPEDGDPES